MVQLSIGEQLSGTPYRVVEAVGSGGMGSVFEVEHAELGKRFVLKVLHHHLASRPDLVGRMRNEWRALAKLNHPSIVQVTDAGQLSSGLPYYVMEKLEGRNLGQCIAQMGRLSPGQAGAIMSDVLDGLHAAHSTGAIHRDVKPQNIFVLVNGRAKLLDFGIAKLKDRAARVVTAGGVSIGTPRYMAPEQAEGMNVDGRADIYAAALVLYEAIAGKGPFAHIRDPNELVLAHIGIDPIRLDEVVHGVPPEWGDLVQRWLSKRPADRPASAGMAAVELRALIHATTSCEPAAHRDVTLGGIYDAETFGAPELSQAQSQRHRLDPPVSMPPDGAVPNQQLQPDDRPRQTEPRSTLGWGTSAPELTSTQTMGPDATQHERGRARDRSMSARPSPGAASTSDRARRRQSGTGRDQWASASAMWSGSSARPQTPAPVSSTPRPSVTWWDRLTPVQKNVVTVVGAAVGSFTVAWLGVHTYANIQSDLASHALSPTQPAAAASLPAALSASVAHAPAAAQSSATPVADSTSPAQLRGEPAVPATLNEVPPVQAPSTAAAAVQPKPAPVGSSKTVGSAPTAQARPSPQATASASPLAQRDSKTGSSAKSPQQPPAKSATSRQLPGSGLW